VDCSESFGSHSSQPFFSQPVIYEIYPTLWSMVGFFLYRIFSLILILFLSFPLMYPSPPLVFFFPLSHEELSSYGRFFLPFFFYSGCKFLLPFSCLWSNISSNHRFSALSCLRASFGTVLFSEDAIASYLVRFVCRVVLFLSPTS